VKRDFYSAVDPMAAEAPAKKPCCTFGCFGGYAMNKRNGCGGPKFTHDVFRIGLRNEPLPLHRAGQSDPPQGGPGYFSRAIAPAVVTGTP
jgi:hypothetical protein